LLTRNLRDHWGRVGRGRKERKGSMSANRERKGTGKKGGALQKKTPHNHHRKNRDCPKLGGLDARRGGPKPNPGRKGAVLSGKAPSPTKKSEQGPGKKGHGTIERKKKQAKIEGNKQSLSTTTKGLGSAAD